MTKLVLDIKKSLDQNASFYFEKAKKAKQKLQGAKEALERSRKKLELLEKAREKEVKTAREQEKKKARKKEWYEKFRWFTSSDGFLCIGGRDATTNEIIIKKHTDGSDLVLHTDMAGSPFFVIKSGGKEIPQSTIEEAAQATAVYSRAWRLGLSTLEVFYVKPEQVSKTTQAGEYMTRGAFMIRGKTNYLRPKLEAAVGMTKDSVIMGGPLAAVKKNCEKYLLVHQGTGKASDAAKLVRKKIGGELDDIIAALPSGGAKVS